MMDTPSTNPEPLTYVVKDVLPGQTHSATIIILHGLGDSGSGWTPVADVLQGVLPSAKFVMLDAPYRTLTAKGCRARAWFDVMEVGGGLEQHGCQRTMIDAVEQLEEFIQAEVSDAVPPERIFLIGFSQGSTVALLFVTTTRKFKIGGVVGLSGYLPMKDKIEQLKSTTNEKTPILICHGDSDDQIPFQSGRESACMLKRLGFCVNFNRYLGVRHRLCQSELNDVSGFLREKMGDVPELMMAPGEGWRRVEEKPCGKELPCEKGEEEKESLGEEEEGVKEVKEEDEDEEEKGKMEEEEKHCMKC